MDEFFYGTLPQDTQDFTQVLKGVRRSIGDVARGVSYYPYDLIGAPVDIINMALTPVGLGSQQPVMGSDYLRNIGKSLGLAQDPTGSIPETVSRIGAGFINPAAGARAVGQIPQAITRGANVSADKLVQMITQNPRATAMGVIDETSMPFMQAMAPKPPGLMEPAKSDIGFYSQLEAATIPLQNKGTGDQYLAQIQKSAGVKPEEIQWTGLDEFLKGKKSVTKTEIQDYLNANRVDVQEVRLGEPEAYDATRLSQLEREFNSLKQHPIDDPSFGQEKYDELIRLMNIRDRSTTTNLYNLQESAMRAGQRAQSRGMPKAAERYFREAELYGVRAEKLDLEGQGMLAPSKFEQYVLPGGENYREILLTLPQKLGSKDDISQRMFGKPYKELTDQERFQVTPEFQKTMGQDFQSTHFDQPNILAHMRVNDRVVDGKKTLFIEEIQSDWHQAGRKRGYQSKDIESQLKVSEERMAKRGQEIRGLSNRMAALDDTQLDEFNALAAERQRLLDLQGEETDLGNRLYDARREGVPDAPFKTSWHELTLKRAIQEASEKGYDQIAFTTGKTQVERYPEALRQVADDISWRSSGTPESGNRFIEIKKSGNTVLQAQVDSRGVVTSASSQEAVGKPIEDLIGKPMGKQVVSESSGSIKGEQFTVGGKGMEGFYDQILPKSLEKLGKKFDAKVGKTEMDGVEVWQMDITPKMRESVTTKGQPLFAVPAVGAGLLGAGMYQDEQMY